MSDLGPSEELRMAARVYASALAKWDDRDGGTAHAAAAGYLQGDLERAGARLERAALAFAKSHAQDFRA